MSEHKTLTPLERELLIERAAIMEYDGNMPRAEAERLAWRDHDHRKTTELIESARDFSARFLKGA
jgi:hypothetical protein